MNLTTQDMNITTRDYFASQAMVAIINARPREFAEGWMTDGDLAERAYQLADAMMATGGHKYA